MADMNIVIAAHTGAAQSEIARLQAKLKSLDGTMAKSRRGANVYGEAVDANTRGLSKFAKSGLQQTGYQVGDFAVQVGGGTSALQAFGQQGSQLFGIFGAGGAIFGAGIAIVAALGNAYLKSIDTVKEFSEEIDELATSTDTYIGLIKGEKETLKSLSKDFYNVTEQVKALHASKIALAKFNLKQQLDQTITALQGEFGAFIRVAKAQERLTEASKKGGKQLGLARRTFNNATTAANALGSELGFTDSQTNALIDKFKKLSELDPFEDASKAAKVLADINGVLLTVMDTASVKSLETAGSVQVLLEQLLKLDGAVTKVNTNVPNMFGLVRSEAEELGGAIATSVGASFKSIIDGTKSTSEAFKSMAASIIDQLIQVLIIQQLVGGVGKGGKNSGGTGLSGFFSGTGKAIGGSVQGNSTYLVGERGPELFMPNSSGSIVPNNKMGGGGGVTVNQTINISTGVSQTVRAEIAQLMPQIANSAKAAVLDAKQRGGSFSKAF